MSSETTTAIETCTTCGQELDDEAHEVEGGQVCFDCYSDFADEALFGDDGWAF